jgi:hypothetical protein
VEVRILVIKIDGVLGKWESPVEILERRLHFREEVASLGVLGVLFDLRLEYRASSLPVTRLDERIHIRALIVCGGIPGNTR